MEVEILGITARDLEDWAYDWFTDHDYREGMSSLYIDEMFSDGWDTVVLGWTDSLQSEYFDWLLEDLQKEFRQILLTYR
tara:strand:- start:207 stop:443 length:237 start_codon:yes stop_codon:yes gene_type:complete